MEREIIVLFARFRHLAMLFDEVASLLSKQDLFDLAAELVDIRVELTRIVGNGYEALARAFALAQA